MIKSCSTCYNYGNNFRLCNVCDMGDGCKTQYRPKQTEIEREYDLACDEIQDLNLEISALKYKYKTMDDMYKTEIERMKIKYDQLLIMYGDVSAKVIEFYNKQAEGETF